MQKPSIPEGKTGNSQTYERPDTPYKSGQKEHSSTLSRASGVAEAISATAAVKPYGSPQAPRRRKYSLAGSRM